MRRESLRWYVTLAVILAVLGFCATARAATYTLNVSARVSSWQATGIYIEGGDTLVFSATGSVRYIVGPDGSEKHCGPGGISGDSSDSCFLAPGKGRHALVGKIGSGPAFRVGSGKTITASTAGELYLGMNDTVYCGGSTDNSGSWNVSLRISGPQSSASPQAPSSTHDSPSTTRYYSPDPFEGLFTTWQGLLFVAFVIAATIYLIAIYG